MTTFNLQPPTASLVALHQRSQRADTLMAWRSSTTHAHPYIISLKSIYLRLRTQSGVLRRLSLSWHPARARVRALHAHAGLADGDGDHSMSLSLPFRIGSLVVVVASVQ